MSNPCPECGFDLPEGSVCPVCGYKDEKAGHAPSAVAQLAVSTPVVAAVARRPRKRRFLAAAVAGAGGLVVLIALLLIVDPGVSSALVQGSPADVTTTPAVQAVPAAPAAVSQKPGADQSAVLGLDFPIGESGTIILNDGPQSYNIAARSEAPPTTSKAAFVAWMLAHTDQKEKFLAQKWDLALVELSTGAITHSRILKAFLRAPREFFARDTRRAYENAVLPIGYGQTISGPLMVGRMTDNLNPQPDQKVLEIGTGSGYQSAFLSELCRHVYTVEIVRPLALETDAIYRKHEAAYPEFGNIDRKIDDGYFGWAEHAPFDRIIVTCGIDHVPPELLKQLAPDGIMVIPVGPPSGQTILKITKHVAPDGTVTLDREDIFKGKRKEIFVPFTSRGGVHSGAVPGSTEATGASPTTLPAAGTTGATQ